MIYTIHEKIQQGKNFDGSIYMYDVPSGFLIHRIVPNKMWKYGDVEESFCQASHTLRRDEGLPNAAVR